MKAIVVLILTALLAVSAFCMVGPQIMIVGPLAVGAGIVLAILRSSLSLVCFGYPLSFGLVSAYIGFSEMAGSERTVPFAISVAIGVGGVGLIVVGLWRTLPDLPPRPKQEPASFLPDSLAGTSNENQRV